MPDTISLPRPNTDTKLSSNKSRHANQHMRQQTATKTTLQPVSEIAEISIMDNDASFQRMPLNRTTSKLMVQQSKLDMIDER